MSATQLTITKAEEIDGYMSKSELLWLADRASESYLIFEIGCYKGRSTRALADNCRGTVVAIDPWGGFTYDNNGDELYPSDDDTYKEFCYNLKNHIDSGKVIIWRFEYLKMNNLMNPDFIFIDGDHRYESVIGDIKKSLEIIKPGGLISGHDYTYTDWPGVKRAVNEIFPVVNQFESIWWINGE